MPTMAFGEYRPDTSDLDAKHTRSLRNVLPQADGYGPMRALAALTQALAAQCRGFFYARKRDNTIVVFAGTETKLYMLNNTTFQWTDVSKAAGTYTTLNANAHWTFAQFNDVVIAAQANDAVQAFNLETDTEFDDLDPGAPDAAYVTVVGRFLVLSGLASEPFRVQWSGLNDITEWTAGTNSSDFQDLPEGGIVRRVEGGEIGIILQDLSIRRMVYQPGSEVVFSIERIGKDIGLMYPYAAVSAGPRLIFLTPKGFMMSDVAGGMTEIGAERVDKTFMSAHDASASQYVLAAADPRTHTAVFTYRAAGSATDGFTNALLYNWHLDKWTPFDVTGEFITSLAQPGLTIEGLDAIAPGAQEISNAANNGSGLIRLTVGDTSEWTTGDYKTISGVTGTTEANGTWVITVINGTTIDLQGSTFSNAYVDGGVVGGSADLMETSWDALETATLPRLSVADTAHKVGFFNGENLEAELETPEQSGDGRRLLITGFTPITDAPTVYGRVSKRNNLNASITYTNESRMNSDGFVPVIRSTKYSRNKIRIPAGTSWSYAKGTRPEVAADGVH